MFSKFVTGSEKFNLSFSLNSLLLPPNEINLTGKLYSLIFIINELILEERFKLSFNDIERELSINI